MHYEILKGQGPTPNEQDLAELSVRLKDIARERGYGVWIAIPVTDNTFFCIFNNIY